MSPFVAMILVPCSLLSADASPYYTALRTAESKGQPLVVLVGADWCSGCVTMKRQVLPALARRGALNAVSVTTVDYDREPALAGKLMRGGTIPQLIVFCRSSDGQWMRDQITGSTNELSVQRLLERAIATNRVESASSGAQ